jgi:peptidoglycan hydrolase-like protein with peptidoglycan-binding domain
MNRVIVLILCLASAAGIAGYTYFRDPGEPTTVYVVPQRPPEPKPKPATVTNIDPSDRAALARALQRELKRVGCYSGEITGQWTTSSRMAMKAFTERVNATLPIDRPDPVLLSLVQGHQEKACGAACPAGQTATEGGACTPNAVAAKAAKLPGRRMLARHGK